MPLIYAFGFAGGVAAPVASLWNPSDKYSTVTLSGGNSVATFGNDGLTRGVRSVGNNASGKKYVEVTATSVTGGAFIGVCLSTLDLSAAGGAGASHAWSLQSNGSYYADGSFSASYSSYTAGDVIGIAMDISGGKLYIAKNNAWQNAGDPVAGTGAVTSSLSGTFYVVAASAGSAVSTLPATNTYAAPTGYSSWG